MIIAEAPAKNEEEQGISLVGPSGQIVWDMLSPITRDEVYVTNVVKVRCPDNDIKKLPLLGKRIEDFLEELDREIEGIKPNCILAFGNIALQYLTGNYGIKKWRGSILKHYSRNIKVVPTIHPAS